MREIPFTHRGLHTIDCHCFCSVVRKVLLLPYYIIKDEEKGVAFDYGPYEIGPYALGMPQALIPYDKIKPYLTPEVKELLGMK